jgi:hypothetical protein
MGRALNCARLNLRHPSKADPDSPRGHTSVRGNCDVALQVENADGLVTVSVRKSRFSLSGESFTYRMVAVPEIDKGVTLRPADQVIPEIPTRWAPDQAHAIAALRGIAPAAHKDWRASLEALGWNASKAKRIITTLAPLTKIGDKYDVSMIDSGSPMVRSC